MIEQPDNNDRYYCHDCDLRLKADELAERDQDDWRGVAVMYYVCPECEGSVEIELPNDEPDECQVVF